MANRSLFKQCFHILRRDNLILVPFIFFNLIVSIFFSFFSFDFSTINKYFILLFFQSFLQYCVYALIIYISHDFSNGRYSIRKSIELWWFQKKRVIYLSLLSNGIFFFYIYLVLSFFNKAQLSSIEELSVSMLSFFLFLLVINIFFAMFISINLIFITAVLLNKNIIDTCVYSLKLVLLNPFTCLKWMLNISLIFFISLLVSNIFSFHFSITILVNGLVIGVNYTVVSVFSYVYFKKKFFDQAPSPVE